ncbi:MAG: nitrate reductase cytochrome c-type subunit [Mariprofundaceae bacterium]
MKKTLWMTGLILITSSLAWASGDVRSLRGDVALDAPSTTVPAKDWYDGEGKINRQYVQQPPLIPHAIEDFSIDRDGNACMSCHNWNSEMPGATKIAISHFVNRQGQVLANISPNRYFCTQCHVPQSNAKPLLLNSFKSLAEE